MDNPKSKTPLHKSPAARQFVKFCIVGLSSTVINFGFVNGLDYGLHWALGISVAAGFIISVFNSFFWNRRWTFSQSRGNSVANQSVLFVIVNIVGLFLNSTIVVGIAVLYERSKGAAVNGNDLLSMFGAILMSQHNFHVPKPVLNGALLVATGVVVFWNYFANRFWTFRHIPPK